MTTLCLTFHCFGLAIRQPKIAKALVKFIDYKTRECVLDSAQKASPMLHTYPTKPESEVIYAADVNSPADMLVHRLDPGVTCHVRYESDNLSRTLAAMKEIEISPSYGSWPHSALSFCGPKLSSIKFLTVN